MEVGILIGIAVVMWVSQLALGLWQFRRFSSHVREMRREGRVAIGKAKGKLRTGAVVLLIIDEECRILRGEAMEGRTVFAGFHPCEAFNGQSLLELDEESVKAAKVTRQIGRAALSARYEYEQYQKDHLQEAA